jgi:alpha-L-fucosidase
MWHHEFHTSSGIWQKNEPFFRRLELPALILVLVCIVLSPAWAGGPNADRETDPAVLASLEKFQDMKFGLFLHWGPCTQWGAEIAWSLSKPMTWARPDTLPAWIERNKDFDLFCRDFFDLNKTFNPRHFDPDLWAKSAKYAGMKYVIFVTKCHDGFTMFDTKQSKYSSTDPSCPFHTNPRANITKEVVEAFRRQGIRAGLYFSMPDWHHPDYEDPDLPPVRLFGPNYDVSKRPEKWQRYVRFVHAQIEELLTGYGPIDILWLDGGAGTGWEMDKLAAMARRHQPGILIVHRGGGRYEDYRTPEQMIPAHALPYAWESCLPMGDHWAYAPNDYYKPARELIHLFVDIVCKGGNLLLDIGPDAEGRLPAESVARLEELGDWMKFNSEAIYGTRAAAPYREGRVRFTRKGDTIYLIHLADLAQNRPPHTVAVSCIQPADGAKVTLLGKNLELKWEKQGHGMVAHIPEKISCPLRGEIPFCRHAWTVKIDKAVVHSDNNQPQKKTISQ